MVNKLLNAEDVAQILGVSKSFAYQLLRQGRIPSLRLGRSVRVREQDLETFVDENIEFNNKMKLPARTGSFQDSPEDLLRKSNEYYHE